MTVNSCDGNLFIQNLRNENVIIIKLQEETILRINNTTHHLMAQLSAQWLQLQYLKAFILSIQIVVKLYPYQTSQVPGAYCR